MGFIGVMGFIGSIVRSFAIENGANVSAIYAFLLGRLNGDALVANSPGRKLKVFQAQLGFYDTVVAVTSQAAALRIWGTHQNLFANGQARIATDAAAIKAALQNPETLLRRAVGSADPFAQEPARLPDVPQAPAPKPAEAEAKPKPKRLPADRSKLDAATDALKKLNAQRMAEEAELRREADILEAKLASAQASYVDKREKAEAAVDAAEKAYRKAGGQH